MKRVTIHIDNVSIDYEGTHEEIGDLVHTLNNHRVKDDMKLKEVAKNESDILDEDAIMVTLKSTVTRPEIEDYLKTCPNYQHTTHTVQHHFFGIDFASTGKTAKAYTLFYKRLQQARRHIQKTEKGNWIEESDGGRLKIFKFSSPTLQL